MKKLVIIGAGGMGRSVYCIAKGCIGYGTEFVVKGLDIDLQLVEAVGLFECDFVHVQAFVHFNHH